MVNASLQEQDWQQQEIPRLLLGKVEVVSLDSLADSPGYLYLTAFRIVLILTSNSLWKTEILSLWLTDSVIVEDFEADRTLQAARFFQQI